MIGGGNASDDVATGVGTNFGFGLDGVDEIFVDDPDSQDDFASGGDGGDQIGAKDGSRDFISCGAGTDTVLTADKEDVVASDCKSVSTVATKASAATKARMRDLEAKVERWAKQLEQKSQQAATSRKK